MPFNEDEFIDSIPNFSVDNAKDYHQLNSIIAKARKLYDDSWPDSTYATYLEKTDSRYIISNIIIQAPQIINKENFVDFIELNPCGKDIIIDAIVLMFEDYWKTLPVYYKEKRYYISMNATEVIDQLGRVPIKNLVAFYTMITIALAPLSENTCPRLENIVQTFSLIFTREALYRVITIEE